MSQLPVSVVIHIIHSRPLGSTPMHVGQQDTDCFTYNQQLVRCAVLRMNVGQFLHRTISHQELKVDNLAPTKEQ